jgi:hypothetical protein
MKNTNLKQFLEMKEKELEDLNALHVTAVASKSTVVYQKYSYTARALEGQMQRIRNQIQGAFNIMENINSGEWVIDHVVFMEKLAEDEFSCHIVVDSKYQSVRLGIIIDKVMEEMGVSNNAAAMNRLKSVKSNIVVNLKRYADFDYKLNWIRDRYFEIANFIDFKNGKIGFVYDDKNTIYDMVSFGDKNMAEMIEAGLYFNVIKNRYEIIRLATEKEMFYLSNAKK